MPNRQVIALLALVGVLISAYTAAYSFGLIGSIVCGTGGCETVQNSPWSRFAGIRVPIIGLAGYGALFIAALLSLQSRFENDRRIALILIAGALIGAGFSAYLTWLEMNVINAWCRWCIGSAVVAGLILVFTLPEFGRVRASTEVVRELS